MKVINLNLNGIRAAQRKGIFPWLAAAGCDFLCVQELKAQAPDLTEEMQRCDDLKAYFSYAQRKGYSGVGLYTRWEPLLVKEGFGVAEFDDEGRYLELHFRLQNGKVLRLISLYAPSGSADDARQASKERFMAVFLPHLQGVLASAAAVGDEVLVAGDWNIAHQKEDLKNWRGNLKNSGFLPEEREWLTAVLGAGLVDVFRALNPITEPANLDQYTWWSARGQARRNNVGWRIDYQFATPGLAALARSTRIDREPVFSDHAALTIDYQIDLA